MWALSPTYEDRVYFNYGTSILVCIALCRIREQHRMSRKPLDVLEEFNFIRAAGYTYMYAASPSRRSSIMLGGGLSRKLASIILRRGE